MAKNWSLDAALASRGVAVCVALGLTACGGGGGGGSNVKPTPPPPPPPVVDTSPMVVNADLAVASGQAITRPLVLDSGADLDNQGTVGGSVDIGVEAKAPSIVNNHGGGVIRGAKTAIRLDHGGEVHNGAGSTIEATGAGNDCGASTKCAIYAGPNDQAPVLQFHFLLENAGTIIGNVRLDQAGLNGVELVAGSAIQGDLDIGSGSGSYLELSGDTGTTQRLSQAVTGTIGFTEQLVKSGKGTWIVDKGWGRPSDITIGDGRLEIADNGPTDFANSHAGFPLSIYIYKGELAFNRSDDVELFAQISGYGSLVKDGAGLLLLTGSTAADHVLVNSGSLRSTSTLLGNVDVTAGATLFGAPGVEGVLTNAGRVITGPGGDARIVGAYSQSSTGTLAVSLGSKLEVLGAATLDGTLEITGAQDGYVANTHTQVLSATTGVTGTFDQLVKGPGVVFTSSTINYDANSVWLDTTGLDITIAAAGGGIGYTPASMSAAERVQGAFEQINDRISTESLAGVSADFLHAAGQFQRAPSIAAAQASLRSLSGQLHAASAAMTFRAIDAGNEALSARFDGLRDAKASAGMWTQRLGDNGSMARSGFDGVGYQMNGWLVGNDYRVGRNAVAGFAFGQGMGVQQLQHGPDRDDSRHTEGMVYAGLAGDRWYAQGRVGFGHIRQLVDRQLLFGEVAEGVWTRYDGRYQAAYGESGLRFGLGELRVAPFASVEYARSDRDAFAEEGAGGFGLRSDAQALTRWQASLGLRATRRWDFGHGRALDFGAHAQWHRTLGMSGDAMDASFVGLQQWSPLAGIGLSRHGSLFGVGLEARLSPRAALKLSYDYERAQYDSAQGVSAGVNIAF